LSAACSAREAFGIVDVQGKGHGKLLFLAKITVNEDHVVEIENYSSEPVRLSEVRETK